MKVGNAEKEATKASTTSKEKGKQQKQRNSQREQPNVDRSRPAPGSSRTPNEKSTDPAKTLAVCVKLEGKKGKIKPSGGSSASSKAASPRSQPTPLPSPKEKLLNKGKTKQSTIKSSSQQQKVPSSLPMSGTTRSTRTSQFRTAVEARRTDDHVHAPEKSRKQNGTKTDASPAPTSTSAMQPAKSDLTSLQSPSGRRHEAVAKDKSRGAQGAENLKKQASPPSGHQQFSKQDRKTAPARSTEVSASPSVLQSPSRPGARTTGSVLSESASTGKTKQSTIKSSSQQQKVPSSLPMSGTTRSTRTSQFRTAVEARRTDDHVHAPEKSRKQSGTKTEASPAPTSTSAMQPAKSDLTSLQSPSGRRHEGTTKQSTIKSSSQQQKGPSSLPMSGTTRSTRTSQFRTAVEARRTDDHVQAPEKSRKPSGTKTDASHAPTSTSAMQSAKSDLTSLQSSSGRRHEAVAKDKSREAQGVENLKKQASPPSGHQQFSKQDREAAPARSTVVSASPSVLQSPSSPGARTTGSVSSESASTKTPSSPQKDQRRAYVVGSLGLAPPSLLTGPLGRGRIPAKPEDILKLLNEDEPPRVRTVNVPDHETTHERPEFVLGSPLSDLYLKFASPRSVSALDSPLRESEAVESNTVPRQLASRKTSTKTERSQSVRSRQSYSEMLRRIYEAESPASVSSKVASKYASKFSRTDGNLCSKDTIMGGRGAEKLKAVGRLPRLVLAAFAVTALCAAIYSVRLLWSAKATAAQALMANFPDSMYRLCSSRGCKSAVREIEESANTSVLPCRDIYSFACGKWNLMREGPDNASVPVQLSYMQVLDQVFVDQVEQQLLSSTHHARARSIGVIYRSCVTFYTNVSARLTHMWPAANIDPHLWLTAADHLQLFDMVIESILTSHLSSIFSLVHHANGTVDVRIGTAIIDKWLYTLRQYMVSTAENLPGSDMYGAHQADFTKLNDAVQDIQDKYAYIENPMVSIQAHEFQRDSVAALFSVPILRHFSRASVAALSVIRYPDDSSVLQMYDVFQRAEVKLAAVYLLHVPFAGFVHFEKETSVVRGHYGQSKTRSICTDFMHTMFKDAFHHFIPTYPHASEFLAYVNALWKRIQEAGSGRPYAGGIRLTEDPVPPNATIALHGTIWNSDKVPEGALAGEYGDDFLVNIICYTRFTGVEVQLDFDTSWSDDDIMPQLLQKPFYYAEATEPFVNYATLGVRVAQLLFDQSVTRSVIDSPSVAACFSTYALSHMRVMFDGRDWPLYAGLAWALETAIDAALGAGRRSAQLERFMIIRFTRTYCGEQAADREPLTYAVKSSLTFARAFGCAEPPIPLC
ncbi:pneumococcal serine-rich repeat protein-like isoform X2 [Dermacentor albipictus]|uniref:pneumococcal serine-rich repeat protein-like isoform X2 n=1 Tax=Dermacentor albipictus TaxID=60249 RepID=UPI0038FC2235